MSITSRIIGFARRKYGAYKKQRAEEKAGFKAISQREAWFMEDRLTVADKQHYCERKGYAQLKYFPNLDRPPYRAADRQMRDEEAGGRHRGTGARGAPGGRVR